MSELFSRGGDNYYLLDTNLKKAFMFDSFGEGGKEVAFIESYMKVNKVAQNVDIISILGEKGEDACELYFKGKTAILKKPPLVVYSLLWSSVNKLSHIVFSVKRAESVNQILIPLSVNGYRHEDIGKILGENLSWIEV